MTITRCTPMNSLLTGSWTSRQSSTASLMRFTSVSKDFACVWQPRQRRRRRHKVASLVLFDHYAEFSHHRFVPPGVILAFPKRPPMMQEPGSGGALNTPAPPAPGALQGDLLRLKIVTRLKIDPVPLRQAEVTRQPQGRVSADGALAMHISLMRRGGTPKSCANR